jgi:hypothetical protein
MRGRDLRVARFTAEGKFRVAARTGVNRQALGGMCSVQYS